MEKTNKAIAVLKNIAVSPRKSGLVAALVRNKNLEEARAILENTDKKSSYPILKLINSAAANAQNNHGMKVEKLYVSDIYVGEGRKLKRMRPAAQGRGKIYYRRRSHIFVTLAERVVE